MVEHPMSSEARPKRWPDLVLIAVSAVGIVWALGSVFAHAPRKTFVPTFSDEIIYYKQAAGFIVAGFKHGYWGDARPAPTLGACDVHGCGFMVVTGIFGRLFGWRFSTALMFNVACLGAAGLTALLVMKTRGVRGFLIVAAMLSSGIVVTYVHAVMQEVFHVAGGLVLVVVAHRVASTPTRRWLAAYFVVGTALSLVRITWVVYLPLIVLLIPALPRRQRIKIAGLGLVLAFCVFVVQKLTIPADSLASFGDASPAIAIAHTIAFNVEQLVSHVEPLYLSFRVTWLALLALPILRRFRSAADRPGAATVTWAWVALGAITVMQISRYDCSQWRDYRVMSAPLLTLVFALASMANPRPARVLLGLQLVLLPVAVYQAYEWNALRIAPARIAEQRRALGTLLPPPKHLPQGNPWCRTVVIANPATDWPRLLAIPNGLGITMLRDPAEAADHPARFLITDGAAPPGRRLLGPWPPGLFIYERVAPGCSP